MTEVYAIRLKKGQEPDFGGSDDFPLFRNGILYYPGGGEIKLIRNRKKGGWGYWRGPDWIEVNLLNKKPPEPLLDHRLPEIDPYFDGAGVVRRGERE